MTTLAGLKIKQHRLNQVPKMSRRAFGEALRPIAHERTVLGWEEEGKIAKPVAVNALAAQGIVDRDDWYRPAQCARCERNADDPVVGACTHPQCPLVERRAA